MSERRVLEERMERLGTIFLEVDELIHEEIPSGYFIMITGPPGIGKGIFAAQYAHRGIVLKESVVYFVTDSHPSEVRRIMKRYGWDPTPHEEKGTFRFIDCYSWRHPSPAKERYSITDPSNLTDVTIEINRAIRGLEKPARIILDSFSSVAQMVPPPTAIRFLQEVDGTVRMNDYNGLYVVEEGMHDSLTTATIRAQADGIFEVKIVEEENRLKRYFRIFAIKGVQCDTRWVPW
ncbi:MAG: RAD55 family ATPase, partial [Candidatus Bathyarchaeia archaeon]